MDDVVGVRELRQNLSRYLDRVKRGEGLTVTEHGRVVARLVPARAADDPYRELVERFGATAPTKRLEDVFAQLSPRSAPDGTTDAFLEESRRDRF
jgi:prevent-host-death family protein